MDFMRRYAKLAEALISEIEDVAVQENLREISRICLHLAESATCHFPGGPAVGLVSFCDASDGIQCFLFLTRPDGPVPLCPIFMKDMEEGIMDLESSLELIDALFIKFNQIVYMRNAHSARYFAGFPIGFNVALGGQTKEGEDATNTLSYLFLKAQDHIALPQPNLSARLHRGSPHSFVLECSRVIGLGSGMPQIMNDESIIPSLMECRI